MINEKSEGPIYLTNHWRKKKLCINLHMDLKDFIKSYAGVEYTVDNG